MTRRTWLAIAAAVALVLLGGRVVAGAFVEYRWFGSLGDGALGVWRARVVDLLVLRGAATLAAFAFAFANLFGVRASVASLILPRRLGNIEIGEEVSGRWLLAVAAAVALALALALGAFLDDWATLELLRRGRPFDLPEPYTGHDLGFFAYWLPLEESLYGWALLVLLVVAAVVLLLYGLTTSLRWERGRVRMTRHVRRHLAILGAILVALIAWGHRLDAYALLIAGSGPSGAFTQIDRAVGLPARFGLSVFTLLAALVVLRAAWLGQTRVTFWAVTAVLAAALLFREVVPAVAARAAPPGAQDPYEAAHAANRAAFTQLAYGVTHVARAPAAYGASDVAALASAVPVWDPPVLAGAIERARRSAAPTTDLGWQPVAGRLAAVSVVRPLPDADGGRVDVGTGLPWEVLLVDATTAADGGGAAFLDAAGDALPEPAPVLALHPLVHPGAERHALVDDSAGTVAGDPVASLGARLAHAWRQRDFRLVFTDDIARYARPEIVIRRDVRERVRALTPFFAQGHTLSPVVAADSLYWVLHLYAASAHIPLSQHYSLAGTEYGYFRHAAVAAVNARTGRVTLVATPEPDPIGASWIRRFPRLFTPAAAVPAALAAALPPATDGMLLQAWVMAQYGARADLGAGVLTLPGGPGGDSTLGVSARALSLLPTLGAGRPPQVPAWTLPMLAGSTRVAGVLVALGGPAPRTLWVGPSAAEPRWRDLNEQLRARADSVAAGTTPDPRGDADVLPGRLRAMPVAGRLVYVQPAYVRPSDGRTRLAVVSVLTETRATAAPSLAEALGLGGGVPAADARAATTPEALRARVRALYASMRDALRRGDWRAFGLAFDSLGVVTGAPPR